MERQKKMTCPWIRRIKLETKTYHQVLIRQNLSLKPAGKKSKEDDRWRETS